MAQKKHRPE